jgi:hypothetical protein
MKALAFFGCVLLLGGCAASGDNLSWCAEFERAFNPGETVIMDPAASENDVREAFTQRLEALETLPEADDVLLSGHHAAIVQIGSAVVGGSGAAVDDFYLVVVAIEERCDELGAPMDRSE